MHLLKLWWKWRKEVTIDGSLLGMGRGAGNAKTELLADFMNKRFGKNYNIPVLLATIQKYIVPLTKDIHWGYDLPMYVCGTKHSHVDNVYHLKEKYGCSVEEMFALVEMLSPQQRTRYGIGYSKTDFSLLDAMYESHKKGERT